MVVRPQSIYGSSPATELSGANQRSDYGALASSPAPASPAPLASSSAFAKQQGMISSQDGTGTGVVHRMTSPSVADAGAFQASADLPKLRSAGPRLGAELPDALSPHSPMVSTLSRANEQQAVVNLVNSILGAAVLSFAFCTKGMGVLLMPLVVGFAALMNRLSQRLMLYSGALSNKMSYEGIAYAAMGRPGTWIIKGCSLGVNFGCLVAYINVTSDVLSSVAGSVIPPGAEPSRQAIMTGVVFAGMIPLSLGVNNTHLLGAMSTVSIGLIAVFTCVMLIMALGSLGNLEEVVLWDWAGLPVSFPIIAFAFSSQTILFEIASSLKAPSVTKMGRVVDKAIFLCGGVYLCCGIGGYLSFRERTGGDVLRNLGAGAGVRTGYERVLKLAYGFSVLTGVPLVLIPIHAVLMPLVLHLFEFVPFVASLLRPDKLKACDMLQVNSTDGGLPRFPSGEHNLDEPRPSAHVLHRSLTVTSVNLDVVDYEVPWLRHALSVVLLVTALVIAIEVPNMEFIFGMIGSTSIPVLSYVMPGCIYLIITTSQAKAQTMSLMSKTRSSHYRKLVTWQRQAAALLLIMMGAVSVLVCSRATLLAVHEEAQVVQVAKELVSATQALAHAQATEEEVQKLATSVNAVDEVTRKFATLKNVTDETYASTLEASTSLEKFQSVPASSKPTSIWNVRAHVENFDADSKRSTALDSLAQTLKAAQSNANVSRAGIEDVKNTLELIHTVNLTARAREAGPPASVAAPPAQSPPAEAVGTSSPGVVPTSPPAVHPPPAAPRKADAPTAATPPADAVAAVAADAVGDAPSPPPPLPPLPPLALLPQVNATVSQAEHDVELDTVLDQADITLASLEGSVAALERVDAAALALSRAQRYRDPVKTLEAIQELQLAINATFATSAAMNQTMLLLQQSAANQTISMHRLLVHMLGEITSGLKEPTTKSAANVFWHAQDTPLASLNVSRTDKHWDPLGSIRGTGSFKFSFSNPNQSPPASPAAPRDGSADVAGGPADATDAGGGEAGGDANGPDGDGRLHGDDDADSSARSAAVAHLQQLAQNITDHINDAKSLDGALEDNNELYLSTLVQAAKAAVEVAKQNTEVAQKNVDAIVATTDNKISTRAAAIAKELTNTAKPGDAPPPVKPAPPSPAVPLDSVPSMSNASSNAAATTTPAAHSHSAASSNSSNANTTGSAAPPDSSTLLTSSRGNVSNS